MSRPSGQTSDDPLAAPRGGQVSISVLDMSVSLDGYIADPDDFLGGDDGERLHKWADVDGEPSGPVKQFRDEWSAAGAVLAGRRTAELMDHWGGSHAGLPIIVPDRGGAADQAVPGAGLRYRAGQSADLAQVILKFLDDNPAAYRQRAMQSAAGITTMDDHFDRLFSAYAHLNGIKRHAA